LNRFHAGSTGTYPLIAGKEKLKDCRFLLLPEDLSFQILYGHRIFQQKMSYSGSAQAA
jgi:hypothetical protein